MAYVSMTIRHGLCTLRLFQLVSYTLHTIHYVSLNRGKGCGYMIKPTMLAGEVSDEIEEARRPNEQRQ